MADFPKKWPIPRNRQEESATSKSPLLAIKAVVGKRYTTRETPLTFTAFTYKLAKAPISSSMQEKTFCSGN